jgi:hypothetical protein
MGRLTVPAESIGTATAVLGSESYTYPIPILHLPGRAGLDLDLAAVKLLPLKLPGPAIITIAIPGREAI